MSPPGSMPPAMMDFLAEVPLGGVRGQKRLDKSPGLNYLYQQNQIMLINLKILIYSF